MEELDHGWQTITGNLPILLVAGHNSRQGRNGLIKAADMGTGDIVRRICEKYSLWGMVSTRAQLDPNWYTDSPFRNEVKNIVRQNDIRLIVDIHGKNLGAENLLELKSNDIFRDVYRKTIGQFRDDDQITLAEEFEGILPVLQLEIREDGRVRTIDEQKYSEAQETIEDLVVKLMNGN